MGGVRQDRIAQEVRRGIIAAAEKHGSDGKGDRGLVGYLMYMAKNHPKDFAELVGRVVPVSKKIERVLLRCTACNQERSITVKQFAKGQPFCPKCGNIEKPVGNK